MEASGFQPKSQTVAVGGKPPSLVRINLVIASQNQTVTVGAQDASVRVTPEVAENQNANTIDRDALDRVPVFDQDYITTLSRFLDDSAIGTNGVTLVVNGLEANGPGVTASAIQEVKINQNPYSALYSRPGRARLEITTKGGTPDFHGTINFLVRNSVFDARNAFADQKPSEQRQFYEGSLTGPISRDKRDYVSAFAGPGLRRYTGVRQRRGGHRTDPRKCGRAHSSLLSVQDASSMISPTEISSGSDTPMSISLSKSKRRRHDLARSWLQLHVGGT